MSHTKSTCVIALGLTIMDRCPECDKIERAAEEAERIERNRAFAARWTREEREPNRAQVTPEELELRATLPCGCDKPHTEGAQFFVSCIEDFDECRRALLLGPYTTHEEALANVDRGRKLAVDNDPKAAWYSFGTCSIKGETERKGVFGT